MLVSCFRSETKPCKTIYILKSYTDSYSDLNRNIQIGPYFFQNGLHNHSKND